MTTERLMTATRVWVVAIVAALLVMGAVGFAWAYGPGRMMQPATYASIGEDVGHCPWVDGRRDGDPSWTEHRQEMLDWQRQLLDGRKWDQLTPTQRWALMDRMHDPATHQWGSGVRMDAPRWFRGAVRPRPGRRWGLDDARLSLGHEAAECQGQSSSPRHASTPSRTAT